MSEQFGDRFSEATQEREEKSAYVCKSCNTRYSHKEAKKKNLDCCGRTMSELLQESFGP